MNPGPDDPSRRSLQRRSRTYVLRLLLYAIGAGLIVVGALRLVGVWIAPPVKDGITRKVLPELIPVDRVEVASGVLRGWSLLLITLDTTRADHLGCYGYARAQTPQLDVV